MDRVNVISEYDCKVHSQNFAMHLTSVIALKHYVHMQIKPAFTRFNVFLRDSFSCQYCGNEFNAEDLTFDHVIPRVRGGRTTWDNVVTACAPCNLRKGHRISEKVGMFPFRKPVKPTNRLLQERGRSFPPNFLHESWHDFLYWDTELDA